MEIDYEKLAKAANGETRSNIYTVNPIQARAVVAALREQGLAVVRVDDLGDVVRYVDDCQIEEMRPRVRGALARLRKHTTR